MRFAADWLPAGRSRRGASRAGMFASSPTPLPSRPNQPIWGRTRGSSDEGLSCPWAFLGRRPPAGTAGVGVLRIGYSVF